MKRIAENMALATLLYVIGGLKQVKIYDYKNHRNYNANMMNYPTKETPREVYVGLVKDCFGKINYTEDHAKVYEVDTHEDGSFVINICSEE